MMPLANGPAAPRTMLHISLVVVAIAAIVGAQRCRADSAATSVEPPVAFRVVDGNAKDNDWSSDSMWIAYPKRDPINGYYDVWTIRPNGTDRRCLTCGDGFPRKHNGNVAWHPSGDYLVFTAQNEDASGDELDSVAIPGVGLNCNLWLTRADGSRAWQLTGLPTRAKAPMGVIHPQFSHDGTKLLWAQAMGRYGKAAGEEWGDWQLAVASFSIDGGEPSLGEISYYRPGPVPRFYESHGWSSDDSSIVYSANPERGKHPPNGLDIYAMDLGTGRTRRLTATSGDWDEHAHFSPDGTTIAWMSGQELDVEFPSVRWPDWKDYLTTELWVMAAGGEQKQRITYFNEPGHAHQVWLQQMTGATGRAVVSDSSWSPDGSQIVFTVAFETESGGGLGSRLVIWDVAPATGINVALPAVFVERGNRRN